MNIFEDSYFFVDLFSLCVQTISSNILPNFFLRVNIENTDKKVQLKTDS